MLRYSTNSITLPARSLVPVLSMGTSGNSGVGPGRSSSGIGGVRLRGILSVGVPGVLLDGGRAVVVGDGVTLPDGGLAVGVTVRVGVRLGGGTDAVVVGVTVGGGVLVRVGVLVGGTEAVGVAVGGRCVLVGVTVGLGGGVSVVRVRVDVGVAVGRVPVAVGVADGLVAVAVGVRDGGGGVKDRLGVAVGVRLGGVPVMVAVGGGCVGVLVGVLVLVTVGVTVVDAVLATLDVLLGGGGPTGVAVTALV